MINNLVMGKLTPKNTRICPGCPPKLPDMKTLPRLNITLPTQDDTKKVTMIDMSKYNKRTASSDTKKNTLF